MRFALLLLWTPLIAQSVHVYSELAQVNAKGEVTAPAQPREILSPAIVRNGFTSFQIVVQVPHETQYWLHVGQNPESAVRITAYRESGDKLEPVELPYWSNSTQVLWIDVWADRNAPVRRVKIEPMLDVNRDWIEYPMEARVMDATVPEGKLDQKPLCGSVALPRAANVPTIDSLHLRNRRQDAALALRMSPTEVRRMMSACDDLASNPESYLKLRDFLFHQR